MTGFSWRRLLFALAGCLPAHPGKNYDRYRKTGGTGKAAVDAQKLQCQHYRNERDVGSISEQGFEQRLHDPTSGAASRR